jgi:murein DD-endopeptidase MepM/ murein hydrolase activator NlpD
LDHGKTRGTSTASIGVSPIELGDEPALSVDGDHNVDRRRVSVQWFSGTILTGLCGAALMGGAVFAALDGEATFAAVPERLENALRGSLTGIGERIAAVTRKSDRLPPVGESTAARQVIRASTTTRVGDREIVRARPFVRISANLALSVTELSANIPPFNPQKMLLGESTTTAAADDGAAEPDAEVSFVTRDLMPLLPRLKIAANIQLDDIIQRVRELANTPEANSAKFATASIPTSATFAYAAEGNSRDPYAGFERIVPENITMLPKTASQTTGGGGGTDKTIAVKKGDSISNILRDNGATAAEIKSIVSVLGQYGRDNGLKEGQRVRLLLSAGSGRSQVVRVIILGESAVEAFVALSDLGKYVPVDIQSTDTQVARTEDDEEEDDGTGVRLYQSIYETALRNQVPRPLIEDLVRIYSYDVDFGRKTQPGDSLELLYVGEDENQASDGRSEVLFASLTLNGDVKRFYRFQTLDDGIVDYYDETGKSAKKFLVRKPVAEGIMRSGFGARNHPILRYTKMHTGVDWAAPMGSPIYSAGNGTIAKVGWEGGYGKYIRIQHANGYETAYGHMTAYARGMAPGVKVRQGQLIGFVGSTGLSTGAHVHYEIHVNGRVVDPMRIKLPRGRSLDGTILAGFEKERDRLDGLMAQPAPRVASTAGGSGR